MYTLVNNTTQRNLLDELTKSLLECKNFYFNVAFISYSGIQLLLDNLQKAYDLGVKGKVITGTYLNFTDPKAVRRLQQFDNVDVRIFIATENQGFHPKAYIFEYEDYYKVIVGSSNLTNYALKSNIEWNLQLIAKNSEENQEFLAYLKESFELIWQESREANEELLREYEQFLKEGRNVSEVRDSRRIFHFPLGPRLKPNAMQLQAVDALNKLREAGESRALAVAATGTGKTYMAAFDVQKIKPKKMLFLVHREMILNKAMESFAKVVDVPMSRMGILSGNQQAYSADYLFATIQTMSRVYTEYLPDEFDYIIFDEAHHATSPSYQRVLDYFRPKFLLGMTATPERADLGNVFDLFDNNLAIDLRLRDALQEGLLVPFHYYGITDQAEIDLSDPTLTPDEMADRLNITSRVDYIIDRMNFYGFDGRKQRALGFCITKKHAQFMTDEFNKRGIPSACLTGESSEEERQRQITLLESETEQLNVIFTVDIFNEGVDIPSVNTVLMLRPTESPIIFTQQLGRGLRKADGKHFLTVLDFIGNYSKSFLIALALHGSRSVNKKTITHEVRNDFRNIPGPSNIRMDEIAKERILQQLEQENFYALQYLKEDYYQFKNALGGKIPMYLQDYLTLEGAPDPVLFFSKSVTSNGSSNYWEFLAKKVERKNEKLQSLIGNERFMEVASLLCGMLPLKRPHDLAVLELALKQASFTFEDALEQVSHYCEGNQEDAASHALEIFQLTYADSKEKTGFQFIYQDGRGIYRFNKNLLDILEKEEFRIYLADILHYGLLRYQMEFGQENYGMPFLKLYQEYSQREVGMMTNYRNTLSSFRGSTLQDKKGGSHYFLFIDLHKEADIEDNINYKDKFISRTQFQWESPNNTTVRSERGKDLIDNKGRAKTIHLFVRKYKTVNNVTQRYTYIGTADAMAHKNEKPIEIQYDLHQKIPAPLYEEFEPEKVNF